METLTLEDARRRLNERVKRVIKIPEGYDASASLEFVKREHDETFKILDSGVIPIPGLMHLKFYEAIWNQGHAALNGFSNLNDSWKDFYPNAEECQKTCPGHKDCLRATMNVWYAQKYILTNLSNIKESRTYDWAVDRLEKARFNATHCLKQESLENCVIELFKIK